jgi:hypothetical protein
MTIIQTKCQKCGTLVDEFYNSDSAMWWAEFMTAYDGELCLDCIKDRPGFKEAFEKNVGISVEGYKEYGNSWS